MATSRDILNTEMRSSTPFLFSLLPLRKIRRAVSFILICHFWDPSSLVWLASGCANSRTICLAVVVEGVTPSSVISPPSDAIKLSAANCRSIDRYINLDFPRLNPFEAPAAVGASVRFHKTSISIPFHAAFFRIVGM